MKYLILIFAVALFSCHPKIISNTVTTTKDSIVYKIVNKRDTVRIPGESVFITKHIPCPDLKPFSETKKSGRSSVTLAADKSGNVTATSNCDSLLQVLQRWDTTTQHFRSSKQVIHDSVIVYRTQWYDMAARWVAVIALLVTGLLAYLKLKP